MRDRRQAEPVLKKISGQSPDIFAEDVFHRMLRMERKRIERSRKSFALLLLKSESVFGEEGGKVLGDILRTLAERCRETDIRGWYSAGTVLGLIFTEMEPVSAQTVTAKLLARMDEAIHASIGAARAGRIELSMHVFPDDPDADGPGGLDHAPVHLDLAKSAGKKPSALFVKRAMDIAGSLAALILLSPVFAAIAVAIRLTSRGPVLFRQVRLGQHGKKFTFLKFRSMYYRNDHTIHETYTKQLITGDAEDNQPSVAATVRYKLTADPRVTKVGKFLRKSSLDELPQFLNVLKGDMSLVGPRPPVTYEFSCYELWHKQRLETLKPGITGLWQIEGRSKVKFNEMVRLDIRYGRSWSLWLDIKILLRTPLVVFSGDGAY